ncbi:uncharacterized protein LOC133730715 [Rosa rugosa]|uniref:uncharacterized protein LOC133730715 n=1 Tax=Rosa rugosa TaxID=74645 RepID=UPI002B4069D9|nr:uncharacterized protein LOC133730715 [Rosa rugosa]
MIEFSVGGIAHGLIFVYAATTSVARRPLWSAIEQIKTSFSGPLLLVGDFNAILGAHEKTGGRLPTRVSCDDFQHMVDVCHLTQIDLKGSPFTWTNGRGVSSHIEMLLGRCFCSIPWLDYWPMTSCSTLVRHSSDHNPLLISFTKYIAQGPIPFRFQKLWLGHSDFLKIVQVAWQSFVVCGCPMFILQRKLKLLKPILKEWNVNVFGNVHTAVDSARAALEKIQLAISLDGFTEVRRVEELLAQDALSHALLVQEKFWAEKARVRWAREGDRNTGYFHTLAKIRRARSSITSLRIGNDLVDDVNILRDHVVQHFTSAFSDDGNIADTDVKNVVFSMNADSAPGPDGYSGHFFQACWDVVGLDVVRAVRSFFQSDRLAPIASRIILPNQFAFLKGRQISDCIFLISECVNLLDNKCRGGNVAIKFDVAKAFDTLNWDFLRRVLNAFGFHATFVEWISSILASARLSILFNGSPVGFFSCSRGVRQGDPLSPLLFCLAEEVLSRGILRLVDMGHVQAISSPRAVKVHSHVLFADDIMVFCKGDKRSLLNLMAFFEEYGLNSGQLVNKTKSHVYLGKSALHRRTLIYSWLGVSVGKLPFMYLGVPIFVGRPKRIYFQVLADRIRNAMSNWRGHSLSMAGRLGKLLCAKVSDFIRDGSWYCSTNLIADLSALWSEISAVRLPYSDMEDKLVWLDSSDGSLSLSIAYEFKRSKQAIVLWDRWCS